MTQFRITINNCLLTLLNLIDLVRSWVSRVSYLRGFFFFSFFFSWVKTFISWVEYFFSWVKIFSCRPNMLLMGRNFSRGWKFFPCPFPLCHCLLKFVSVNNASYFDGPWSDQDVRKTTYLLKSGKLVILVRTKWVFVGLVPLWVS